jgi:hypothetical protein
MRFLPINRVILLLFLPVIGLFPGFGSADMGLVNMLTSELGVTEQQARGGSGAIFALAKERMSNDEFAQIQQTVPGVDALVKSAPKPDISSAGVANVTSMLGNTGGSLGALGSITGVFSRLGMGTDMITRFTPIIYDYVKQKGGKDGEKVMTLLKNALQ